MTGIMDGSTSEMLARVNTSDQIHTWSDEKKRDFVKTFDDRARVARYILIKTGHFILENAKRRQFIGVRQFEEARGQASGYENLYDEGSRYYNTAKIGGRPATDIGSIAEERANLVIKELPPLKRAVEVIDKDTAEKIERRDKILAELRKCKARLEEPELAGPIVMAELDQEMTIGEFRQLVKDRSKKRKRVFEKMGELAGEGNELEEIINKKLYKGLPGLSEAVIAVAQQHFDRAVALDEMDRRIGERVMFGDSEAALEMLKGFEKDEQSIPNEIKAEFRSALEKLKVSKKQLGAGTKSRVSRKDKGRRLRRAR
jgi:hypothetical protein